MAYDHDVFISYKRSEQSRQWVQRIFKKMMDYWLTHNGHSPSFYDAELEAGESWAQRLASVIGRSKVLVPLLTPDYFTSKPCMAEFNHMRQREQQCGLRTATRPKGIIVPVITMGKIERFPADARRIQAFDLRKFANPWMLPESAKAEAAADQISEWVSRDLLNAIAGAPPCDEQWPDQAADLFNSLEETGLTPLSEPPSLGGSAA